MGFQLGQFYTPLIRSIFNNYYNIKDKYIKIIVYLIHLSTKESFSLSYTLLSQKYEFSFNNYPNGAVLFL